VTEGNGHVIDPAGDARRALHAAVAEHGPEALSNSVIMDAICQDRLSDLPGEAILIGSAARTDVPALLRDRIATMGNYGAIQSVATTLAEAHGLDNAACLWVVREYARALGLIASGGTYPTAHIGSGSGGDTGQGTAPPPMAAEPPASAAAAWGAAAGAGAAAAPAMTGAGVAAGGDAGAGATSGEGAVSQGTGSGSPAGAGAGGMGAAGAGPAGRGAAGAGPAGRGAAGAGPASSGAGSGPGFPAGMPEDVRELPPRRTPSKPRVFTRNTIGVAAAIALVAGYLGVAAVAHLSPFPAKTVAATSSSPPPASRASSASPSPDETPTSSPPSDYQILLSKIPHDVQGTSNCHNYGTGFGATAASACTGMHGLAANVIYYYLFPDSAAVSNGYSNFLKTQNFPRHTAECKTNGNFVDFIVNCESTFTSTPPNITGNIAEYPNKDNRPIIVTTDNPQHVMVIMVGTNAGDLLAYWRQMHWVVP
jgi:hypothetical protein